MSTVGGGSYNKSCGDCSTVSGGYSNIATGSQTTIGGGFSNRAFCLRSTVGGGYKNEAVGSYSTISGGDCNRAENTATASFIGGGKQNCTACVYSAVVGGLLNVASGDYSAVVAGSGNIASFACSFVGGGTNNKSCGASSTVTGGRSNQSIGSYSFIGGGDANYICNTYTSIGGGRQNCARGQYNTISGGYLNSTNSLSSAVVGGVANWACNCYAFVGGGYTNRTNGYGSAILGGTINCITSNALHASIGGGQCNFVDGSLSTIVGGYKNTASGNYSAILGGGNNYDGGYDSVFILCTGITATQPKTTYTQKLYASDTLDPSGTIFNVEGSNGSLFSIVDSLYGSLMSVNNIVGLPIFEVFDNDTVIAGRYGENDLYVSSSGNVGLGTGSPTEKLHVDGNFRLTGAIYDINNSPGSNGEILTSTVSGVDWVSLSAGGGLTLAGTTFSHTDTSSQASVDNSNGTVIQDVTLDTYGHVTALGSVDLDWRYYTETEIGNFFSGTTGITGYNKANWDTAFGWGNHVSAGYQSAATALTTSTNFGGDVSGTYNNIVVADDSHNHIISNIDGLQTALNNKLETSLKGANNGLAELDSSGKVPTSQLPSYVDDVL